VKELAEREDLTAEHKRQIFAGTARRLYRL
jgi:hypothetical protein